MVSKKVKKVVGLFSGFCLIIQFLIVFIWCLLNAESLVDYFWVLLLFFAMLRLNYLLSSIIIFEIKDVLLNGI